MSVTQARSALAPHPAQSGRGFLPALEGVRALAAIGVMTTHVAFQTGSVRGGFPGAVWGRFDMAVALFFALSGFLLWRGHAFAAWGDDASPDPRKYLRHRIIRIWPAYLVVVVTVLLLLPEARGADASVWLANLTLTQVFVPLSLTAGLTQMWSLSVEVSFYLVLPLAAWALSWLRGDRARWRIPLLLVIGAVSLGWAWVGTRLPLADGVEPKNWLLGHLPWFLGGLVLAELCARGSCWLVCADRRVMWPLAAAVFAVSCTPAAGPAGLGEVGNGQFAAKMILGAVLGFSVLSPLVLVQRQHRFLTSSPMAALGRWSYGIFIWHLVVLAVVFPAFAIVPFHGSMPLVWVLTLALTIGVSAASYAFVEEPCRRWLRSRESRGRRG